MQHLLSSLLLCFFLSADLYKHAFFSGGIVEFGVLQLYMYNVMASVYRSTSILLKICMITCIVLFGVILIPKFNVFSTGIAEGSKEKSISLYAQYAELHVDKPRKLVMALNYYEKTTMATRNFMSLSQFTTDWNANIILPFFHDSRFQGIPSENNTHFGDIVNLTQFQQIYREMNLTPFVEFEFFIASGSRNIYHIAIEYGPSGIRTGPIQISCSKLNNIILKLNEQATKTNSPLFSTAQSICCRFSNSNPIVPEDIAKGCGFSDKEEYTVIISSWHGHRTFVQKNRAINYKIYAPEYKKSVTTVLPLTDALISDARAFYEDLVGGSDITFIGVHIRAQRLLKQIKVRNTNATNCIVKGIELANSFASSQDLKVVYFGDYHVSQFKDLLEKFDVEVVRFDPAEYGHTGAVDEAYVAQVEQTAIAQAKQLVLMGGGTFQENIVARCECPHQSICHEQLPD